VLYQVEYQDPDIRGNHYVACVCFDPSVKPAYTTDDEYRRAAAWIIEKLLNADFPVFPTGARIHAVKTDKAVDTLTSNPIDIGAGISIWLDQVRASSRLQEPAILGFQIAKMREEVRLQQPIG
jgi:hypothetical protein